ncbi:MAG: hypothetical protein EBT80_00540 [Chitinophagales bacterium]|nr:hypothetical protein [Chitinophagales bacterium]
MALSVGNLASGLQSSIVVSGPQRPSAVAGGSAKKSKLTEGDRSPSTTGVTPVTKSKQETKMNLNTPDKVDKNRRVAWAMYYELLEENRKLRNELSFFRANKRKYFRLFQLIRRTKTVPEVRLLAEELRKEMYHSDIMGLSSYR